jgi:NAD(P)-dependent dehydrogenase (short-subunit alcohol dehydrogenase family)
MQREIQRVVVMGGSSGIGEAAAALFASQGDQVVITGRDEGRLRAALDRLGHVRGEVVDGTDAVGAAAFFERTGPFDHLVLAMTGATGAGTLAALDLADLRAGLEAKLFAHLTSLKAALPTLRRSVTFVTAASARAALAGTAGLAALNGAIEAAVRPLAAELAPIRVNAVSPGVIDTPFWSGMADATRAAHFAAAAGALPVRRVGRPEEVASAIAMVARNGFMTGTVLEVDGGLHLPR